MVSLSSAEIVERLGDAEVEHLADLLAVLLSEEHVGRLEIAMHDTGVVRRVQRLGHLHHDPRRVLQTQPDLAREQRLQILAAEQLHDDVGAAVLDAVVVHLRDVGAAQPGDAHRLALETGQRAFRLADPLGDELDRDVTAQLLVVGRPHRSHPALAELVLQAVALRDDDAGGRLEHATPSASVSVGVGHVITAAALRGSSRQAGSARACRDRAHGLPSRLRCKAPRGPVATGCRPVEPRSRRSCGACRAGRRWCAGWRCRRRATSRR